jgi:hypothetical protein
MARFDFLGHGQRIRFRSDNRPSYYVRKLIVRSGEHRKADSPVFPPLNSGKDFGGADCSRHALDLQPYLIRRYRVRNIETGDDIGIISDFIR